MIVRTVLGALVLAAAGLAQEPLTAVIQLAAGEKQDPRTVLLHDVDADGRLDLVRGLQRADGVRELRIHLRRAAGEEPMFAVRPDRRVDIDRRAVAFAFADLFPEPGAELVLWFPEVVVAYVPAAAADQRYRRICDCQLLWQAAQPEFLFAWQAGVSDVDGDGRQDLLVPQSDGYRVVLQREMADGAAGFVVQDLEVPPLRRVRKRDAFGRLEAGVERGGRFDLQLTDGSPRRPSAPLRADTELPSPHLQDIDGDGRRDLLLLRGLDLHVWLQTADAAFDAEPSFTRSLPDRLDRLLDPAFAVLAVQADGDGCADIVVASSVMNDGEPTSVVELFRGRRAAGDGASDRSRGGAWFDLSGGRADQRLRFPGLVLLTHCDDVQGDGRADLVVARLRTDLLDGLGGSDAIDVRLSVFVGQGDGFRAEPVLRHDAELTLDEDGARGGGAAVFFADLDGDGLRELLQRTSVEQFSVFDVERRGQGQVVGAAQFEQRITAATRFVFAPDARAVLVAVEQDQLRCFAWGADR